LLDHVHHEGEQVTIASALVDLYERLLLIRGTKEFDCLFALRLPAEAAEALRADPARYQDFLRTTFMRWNSPDYIRYPALNSPWPNLLAG
jgi:hypothetical protein